LGHHRVGGATAENQGRQGEDDEQRCEGSIHGFLPFNSNS
jgi:hypothetical protein